MRKVIFSQADKLYKTNLHCHTTESDGKLTPKQIKEVYKSHGYSVVAITDHEFMIDHSELNDEDFIILPGYEIAINEEGKSNYNQTASCHINLFPKKANNFKMVCFNYDFLWLDSSKQLTEKFQYVGTPNFKKEYSADCFNEIIRKAKENDMFVMLNHPAWSMLTPEVISSFEGLWGMEIFNTGAVKMGLNCYETHWYDMLLKQGKRLFCTATDDCHSSLPPEDPKSDCCGGYLMVKADSLCHNSIIEALLKGDFYSSTGAEIYELYLEDNKLHIKCDPCRSICLKTKHRRSEGCFARQGEAITEAVFSVYPGDEYVRIETENLNGKRAFTNAFHTDELLKA